MAYKGSKTQRSRIKGLSQAGNKAASDARLDNFIKSNQDLKNQSTIGSILNTVSDKPQLFGKNKESRRDFIERQINKNDGRINAATQAMLDFYDDGRNDYSRGLNSLRTSSPAMMDAYARKFPVENFAMQAGPMAFGAMTGIPVAALQAGFDRTKQGAGLGLDSLRRAGEFLKKGIDVGASAIDKGMNFAKDRVYDVEDALYYNTPIRDLPETKDKIVDIFQDAIAKREDDNTFTPQNVPGGGDNFRKGFDSFLTDVPQAELKQLDPLANTKLSEPTGSYFDTSRGFPQMNMAFMPVVGETPEQTFRRALGLANFNEGGLASLNNPDYNRLMGASNFGF
jgi:hypothetical protein